MKAALILLVSLTLCRGADWYASTTGTAGAAGTLAAPLSLVKAIGDTGTSPVGPGDTLWILGGTYDPATGGAGLFTSQLTGTAGNPIIVRPYAGERVIIQATTKTQKGMDIYGAYTRFYGLEFANSSTDRGTGRGTGALVWGPGTRLINCVFHDIGTGVYVWEGASPCEISGCLLYYCGALDNLTHGIYSHSYAAGTIIRDNLILNGTGFGLHLYSGDPNQLQNFSVLGNLIVRNDGLQPADWRAAILLGGEGPVVSATLAWNMTYRSSGIEPVQLGYLTYENSTLVCSSNYFAGGALDVGHWSHLTYTWNTNADPAAAFEYRPSGSVLSQSWDGQFYQSAVGTPFIFNGSGKSWTTWKSSTGFDGASSFTTTPLNGTFISVRTNLYEAGRANIAIYNWGLADNVSVDPSSAMTAGAAYTVRNAADWFGPVVKTGTYAGGLLSLPMTNLTAATPVGVGAPSVTGPEFNAFILLSTNSVTPPVPPSNLTAGRIIAGRIISKH